MAKLILFVCTGNTCRSPLAEGLATHWLENNGYEGWEVASAGTFAAEGCPTSKEALQALRNRGIEFSGTSTTITKELVDLATAVFCMTKTHCKDVASVAEKQKKIELLDLECGIVDPVGCDQSVYDGLAEKLAQMIPPRLLEIIEHHENVKE